jgi:hypothetical protein
MGGKSTRIGAYKCYQCRKPFTVKIGTIFEASHVPMRHWLQAMYMMAASKKGVSSNQIHRTLGCTLKTAWFITHRLREAMRDGSMAPFGGNGGDVEADETYIGRDPDEPLRPASYGHKMKVMSLVDRSTGRARSFMMDFVTSKSVGRVLTANVAQDSRLLTDSARYYIRNGMKFTSHSSVNHTIDKYVSFIDPTVHTNTIEGFFSIFKRGMKGVYQHCAKHHLQRYLAEFDFRYSHRVALGVHDVARADIMLAGVVGKRLTYRTVGGQA